MSEKPSQPFPFRRHGDYRATAIRSYPYQVANGCEITGSGKNHLHGVQARMLENTTDSMLFQLGESEYVLVNYESEDLEQVDYYRPGSEVPTTYVHSDEKGGWFRIDYKHQPPPPDRKTDSDVQVQEVTPSLARVQYENLLHQRKALSDGMLQPWLRGDSEGGVAILDGDEWQLLNGRVCERRVGSQLLLRYERLAGACTQVDLLGENHSPTASFIFEFGCWQGIKYLPEDGARLAVERPKQRAEASSRSRLIKVSDRTHRFRVLGHNVDMKGDVGHTNNGAVVLRSYDNRVVEEGDYEIDGGDQLAVFRRPSRGIHTQVQYHYNQPNIFGQMVVVWVYRKETGWAEAFPADSPERWELHAPYYRLPVERLGYQVDTLGSRHMVKHLPGYNGSKLSIPQVLLSNRGEVVPHHGRYALSPGVTRFPWGQVVVTRHNKDLVQVDFIGYPWAGFDTHRTYVYELPREWLRVIYPWEKKGWQNPTAPMPRDWAPYSWQPYDPPDEPLDRGELAKPILDESESFLDMGDVIANSDTQRPANIPAIHFGGMPLRERNVLTHFFVHGMQGSGKSTLIKHLLLQVLSRLNVDPRVRILATDPKGDLTPLLDDLSREKGIELPYKVLNPFDARSVAWDMSRDLNDSLLVSNFGAMLFPVEKSRDEFWPRASRLLFEAIVQVFNESKSKWRLADVINATSSPKVLTHVLEKTAAGKRVVETLKETKGTQANLIQNIQASLREFQHVAAASEQAAREGKLFSIRDWATRQGNHPPILVLNHEQKSSSILNHYYRALIRLATDHLLSGPETKSPLSWLFVDEAQMMADTPELQETAERGRSKGIVLVLGTQNALTFSDRARRFDNDTASFLGGIGNKALLRCEHELAEWSSKFFGKGWRKSINESQTTGQSQGKESHTSTSMTTNTTDHEVPVVGPDVFASLPLATPENGIHGYVISDPDIRGGQWKLNWPTRNGYDAWPPPPRSEHHPRGDAGWLSPWDADDLDRLGLPLTLLSDDAVSDEEDDEDYLNMPDF